MVVVSSGKRVKSRREKQTTRQRWCSAHLLGSLEGELGRDGDGDEVLVGVDQGVVDGDNGGEVDGERDGGDGLDRGEELVDEGLLVDVEHLGSEDGSVVEDLDDRHTVRERRDVEHVQEGGLGGSDSGSGGDDLDVGDNLDGSSGNLGRDRERLEEGGLSGLHAGVTSGDPDVLGGERSSSGGGGDLVVEDDLSDLLEVSRGEDESNVSLDVGEELLELRVLSEDGSERSSNHGVLSHEDGGLASESLSDLVH